MRIAHAHDGKAAFVGLVDPDGREIRPLALPKAAILGALAAIDRLAAGRKLPSPGMPIPLAECRLLAPIPRPRRNIFCIGKNYREHAQEFARSGFDSSAATAADAIPAAPIVFTKVPECVTGPGDAIPIPAISSAIDYEAELAVIIGRGGKAIAKADAMAHVAGYTIVNDVTARDLQGRHKQWLIGKALDGFCPMGPWIVTADALDGSSTQVRCWVNDELRQDQSTRDLIFDIPTLIATISAGITLYPGDIIATGTPVGVGIGFDPPRYLQPGDRVRIEIEGIGTLENPVA